MYNEQVKSRFISETISNESTAKSYITIMNMLEKIETELGKDFCSFTDEEAQRAFDSIAGLRSKSKWASMILLRDYSEWCVRNNIEGSRLCMDSIKDVGLDKVRTMMVAGPEHLQEILDAVFDLEEAETMDIVSRSYYWLAFSGVQEEDIVEIKDTDIDFNSEIIRSKGGISILYKQSLPAIKRAAKLTEFSYHHPGYNNVIKRNRVPGRGILRGIKSQADLLSMRAENSRKVNRMFKDGKIKTKISFSRVYLSGLFYRQYMKEVAGQEVDFSEAADKFMRGKEYNMSSGRNTIGAKRRQIIKDYSQDYERWKAVFCV